MYFWTKRCFFGQKYGVLVRELDSGKDKSLERVASLEGGFFKAGGPESPGEVSEEQVWKRVSLEREGILE